MNNAQQLDNLAEAVREEGLNQGGSMKDLVFDPVTGEFRPVPRGTHHGEGDVVTEMTDKGFASYLPGEVVVIREDELRKASEDLNAGGKVILPAEELEEGVFHILPRQDRLHEKMKESIPALPEGIRLQEAAELVQRKLGELETEEKKLQTDAETLAGIQASLSGIEEKKDKLRKAKDEHFP